MVDMAEERVQKPKQRKAISPAKRARLEETFKRASKKPTGPQDFDFAAELLAQCVIGDPGNPTYVRAYIENLQKKYQNNKTGQPNGLVQGAGSPQCLEEGVGPRAVGRSHSPRPASLESESLGHSDAHADGYGGKGIGRQRQRVVLSQGGSDEIAERPDVQSDGRHRARRIGTCESGHRVLATCRGGVAEGQGGQGGNQRVSDRGESSRRMLADTASRPKSKRRWSGSGRFSSKRRWPGSRRFKRKRKWPGSRRFSSKPRPSRRTSLPSLELYQTDLDDNPNEKAKLPRVRETAESAYKEGYDYGIERRPKVRASGTRGNLLSLAVMLVTWLIVLAFVALRWGPSLWKHARWPWWAWIVLGVVMLAVALGLRARQKQWTSVCEGELVTLKGNCFMGRSHDGQFHCQGRFGSSWVYAY